MTRVLSGVLLAAAISVLVWFGNEILLLLVALAVCTLAFREFAALVDRIGAHVPRFPTLMATLAAVAVVPFPVVAVEAVVGIGLVVIATAVLAGFAASGARDALLAAAASALAIVYLGIPLGTLVGVYTFGGRGAVVLLIATVAISDTAQYYAGRLLGRRLLAPAVSPRKTVEGAAGGLLAGPAFLAVAGPYFVPVATPLSIAPLGLGLVAAGIVGDLFESTLKRAAEVKDSSGLIPGHGGVLDRIDALLLATPVFYIYVRWVYSV